MLGEVNPSPGLQRKAAAMIRQHEANRKEKGVAYESDPSAIPFLQEAFLLMQGFTWIRDYRGEADGCIEHDYRRMCWKEDRGELDAEFAQMANESDKETSLLRRLKLVSDRIRHGAASDLKLISGQKKHFSEGSLRRTRRRGKVVKMRPRPPNQHGIILP